MLVIRPNRVSEVFDRGQELEAHMRPPPRLRWRYTQAFPPLWGADERSLGPTPGFLSHERVSPRTAERLRLKVQANCQDPP